MSKFRILDGGMGRELKRIGAPFTQPLWSAQALMEAPDFVEKAHQNFIDAGAEIITVNSYACVPYHLGDALYQEQGAKLAEKAAKIARKVVQNNDKHILVAGSLAPAFGSYRPDLFKKEEALIIAQDLFNAQDTQVDIWIAETISSLEEFLVMHQVLSQSDKPAYYSFSLKDDENNTSVSLRSEMPLQDLLAQIKHLPMDGVLFNCSMPEVISKAIKETKTLLSDQHITVGGYANNFIPIRKDHQANDTLQGMRELSAEDYLTFAKQWINDGATLVGGCCGIYPEHIQAIHQWKTQL